MSEGDYLKWRRVYQDVSGSREIAAADTSLTLKAVRGAGYTIFLQRVHIQFTTGSAGKTWDLKDSAGTPKQLTGPHAGDTDGSHVDVDFGPDGLPLTEAKDLTLVISAAGAGGTVTWEAYQKQTSTLAASAL